eukprot:999881-Prorocentrum_minimum.AAC.1
MIREGDSRSPYRVVRVRAMSGAAALWIPACVQRDSARLKAPPALSTTHQASTPHQSRQARTPNIRAIRPC